MAEATGPSRPPPPAAGFSPPPPGPCPDPLSSFPLGSGRWWPHFGVPAAPPHSLAPENTGSPMARVAALLTGCWFPRPPFSPGRKGHPARPEARVPGLGSPYSRIPRRSVTARDPARRGWWSWEENPGGPTGAKRSVCQEKESSSGSGCLAGCGGRFVLFSPRFLKRQPRLVPPGPPGIGIAPSGSGYGTRFRLTRAGHGEEKATELRALFYCRGRRTGLGSGARSFHALGAESARTIVAG